MDGVDGAAEAQPRAVGEDDLRPVAAVDAGEHLAHRRLPLAVAQRALVAQQAGQPLQRGRQRLARRPHPAEQRQRRRRRLLEAGGDRESVGVGGSGGAADAPPQVAREVAGAVVAELELEEREHEEPPAEVAPLGARLRLHVEAHPAVVAHPRVQVRQRRERAAPLGLARRAVAARALGDAAPATHTVLYWSRK